jgi:methyl-accepting chemotaxis protein
MDSTMTIGKRFIITSGALVCLSMILVAVAIVSLNSIGKDVNSLATDTTPGIVFAASMRGDVLALRGDYLKHINESDAAAMARVEQSIATNDANLARDMKSYEDAITSDEDRANFEKLKPEVAAVRQGWETTVRPVSRLGKNVDAYQLYNSAITPSMDLLKVQLVQMVDWNKKVSDTTLANTTSTVQGAWWTALLVGLISIAVGAGLSWFMITAMNKELSATVAELSDGAVQIASAASQVASSSQSLAQGSSEQAASLEETSSTTEEINSMAAKNTENSGEMTRMVEASQQDFTVTNGQLIEMVTAMEEINNSSAKISKIIKVIDEIAFQTNILALNAAVEAARAGEAGMGFAVVADEVRNLAQRCAQAAKDTADLIEDSISKSGSGKAKVGQVAEAIRGIIEEFNKVKILVDEVSHGSKEQTDGIGQVRRALSNMEQVSQSTAANAEESAAAAQDLNAQSEALKNIVTRLNSMAGLKTAA